MPGTTLPCSLFFSSRCRQHYQRPAAGPACSRAARYLRLQHTTSSMAMCPTRGLPFAPLMVLQGRQVVHLGSRPGTCCRKNPFSNDCSTPGPPLAPLQGRQVVRLQHQARHVLLQRPRRHAAGGFQLPQKRRQQRYLLQPGFAFPIMPRDHGKTVSRHRLDLLRAPHCSHCWNAASCAAYSGGGMQEGLLTMAGCNLRPCSETHHGRSSRRGLCMCVAGSKRAMRSPYRRQPHFDAGRREARRSGARGRAHVCPQGSSAVSQQRLRGQRRFVSVAQTRNCCRILSIAPMTVAHTEQYLCAIPLTWLSAWLPSQRRSAEHACCAGTTGWAVLPAVSNPTLDAHLLLARQERNAPECMPAETGAAASRPPPPGRHRPAPTRPFAELFPRRRCCFRPARTKAAANAAPGTAATAAPAPAQGAGTPSRRLRPGLRARKDPSFRTCRFGRNVCGMKVRQTRM